MPEKKELTNQPVAKETKTENNKNAEGQAFQGTNFSPHFLPSFTMLGSERATGFQSTLKCVHFLSYSGRIITVLWRCHGPSNFNRHFYFSKYHFFKTCPYCGLKVYKMSLALSPNQCPSLLHLNPCVLYISPTKDLPSRKLLTHTHTKNASHRQQKKKNVHNRNDNYNDC